MHGRSVIRASRNEIDGQPAVFRNGVLVPQRRIMTASEYFTAQRLKQQMRARVRAQQYRARGVRRQMRDLNPFERERVGREREYERLRRIYSAKDIAEKTWNLAPIGGRRYSNPALGPSSFYYGLVPTIYVSMNGSGTMSGASEANSAPILDVLASALDPSDIIGMLQDTYIGDPDHSSEGRWHVIFKPVTSGVTLVAKYPAAYNEDSPELWCDFQSSDPAVPDADPERRNSPVVGPGENVTDTTWIGGYLDQATAPPRPSNGSICIGTNADDTTFEAWLVDQTVNPDNDNWDTWFIEFCDRPSLQNNKVRGGADISGATNHNASAVTTYGVYDFDFGHNEFEDVNQAYFIKGSANLGARRNWGRVHHNKCLDASQAFIDFAVIDATEGVTCDFNFIARCGNRCFVLDVASPTEGGPIRIDDNTSIDTGSHVFEAEILAANPPEQPDPIPYPLTGCTVRRNILTRPAAAGGNYLLLFSAGALQTVEDMLEVDENLYYSGGDANFFRSNDTNRLSFGAWVSNTTDVDENSSEGDPGITDDDGHRSSYADGIGCRKTGTEVIGLEPAP
jgi:hypothetical protein